MPRKVTTDKDEPMNAPALRTVKVMRRARLLKWAGYAGRVIFVGSIYAAGYVTPRAMVLPPVGKPVIVYTATRVNVAWMDESGTFRSVENGMPIKQVTEWKTP